MKSREAAREVRGQVGRSVPDDLEKLASELVTGGPVLQPSPGDQEDHLYEQRDPVFDKTRST